MPTHFETLVEGLMTRLLPNRTGKSGQTPEFGPYPSLNSVEELTLIHRVMAYQPFEDPKEEELRQLILRKLNNALTSDPRFRLPHE